jgi:hypothetical protein
MAATDQQGTLVQFDTPDWTALAGLLPLELCAHFMWIDEVRLRDGTRLDAYKHRWTRRYLHLARDGRAFWYVPPGCYREVDTRRAIVEAFEGWESCEPTESEKAALNLALRKADAIRRQ